MRNPRSNQTLRETSIIKIEKKRNLIQNVSFTLRIEKTISSMILPEPLRRHSRSLTLWKRHTSKKWTNA